MRLRETLDSLLDGAMAAEEDGAPRVALKILELAGSIALAELSEDEVAALDLASLRHLRGLVGCDSNADLHEVVRAARHEWATHRSEGAED